MRERYEETTIASSDVSVLDLQNMNTGTYAGGNPSYKSHVSHMWDLPSKEKHSFKPCLHLVYDAVVTTSFDSVDNSDASNAPDPRTKYFGRTGSFHYGQKTPPVESQADLYISVTGRSTDDVADCIFNAYNQFISSARSLDASQSICEAGETPQLFNIWQRRKGLATNLVNGFLNYSFGWRPVLSDLRAIRKELSQFPKSVRERLRRIGDGPVTRHYKFNLDDTIDNYQTVHYHHDASPYWWSFAHRETRTKQDSRKRKVVVTIRANVKPKLTGKGQDILNKLGTLGLIPSLATLWSVTRLSFVVDWFYNIGGAIENLQGCLTHDVSNVKVCVTDTRSRTLEYLFENDAGQALVVGLQNQRYFRRIIPSDVPRFVPQLKLPNKPMQYVLLGFLALVNTAGGKQLLRSADRYEDLLNRKLDQIERSLNRRLGLPNTRAPKWWGL